MAADLDRQLVTAVSTARTGSHPDADVVGVGDTAGMTADARFPFGRSSTPRRPRVPEGATSAIVVGVYPSALHVQWTLPTWAHSPGAPASVRAIAVDDEPTVFWDGADAPSRVAQWISDIGFQQGDGEGQWGHVRSSGNGTSGTGVVDDVLAPLGLDPSSVWFTDVVDRFFVKRERPPKRGQADVIDQVYEPFRLAAGGGLRSATLPPRPSAPQLIALASTEHRERLRQELTEAQAPVLITLGEEARAVVVSIVDTHAGPPGEPITARRFEGANAANYGEAGSATVTRHKMRWYALAHPGQRTGAWPDLRRQWVDRRQSER
jgi:hypothetical protein